MTLRRRQRLQQQRFARRFDEHTMIAWAVQAWMIHSQWRGLQVA